VRRDIILLALEFISERQINNNDKDDDARKYFHTATPSHDDCGRDLEFRRMTIYMYIILFKYHSRLAGAAVIGH